VKIELDVTPEIIETIAARTAEILLADIEREPKSVSPFLTIPEAAELLRAKRQRVDDLLSAGRLARHKDGSRTLVSRAELLEYLKPKGAGR
jgi:excisionase family DNA binding protein